LPKTNKATYQKATAEVFGVPTAFHIVSQPVEAKGEIRLTVNVQMPALRFEGGALKVLQNPKNKP
jgi:hypothetical protein